MEGEELGGVDRVVELMEAKVRERVSPDGKEGGW